MLTPVDSLEDWLFKREDLFTYDCLNGTKARFILDTLSKNREIIRNYFNNTVKLKNNPTSHSYFSNQVICRNLGINLVNLLDREVYFNYLGFPMNQRAPFNELFHYEEVIKQVANIPKNLDNFVISAGSCQTLYAVLKGFLKYQNKPNRIIVIGNKDPNPLCTKLISDLQVEFYNRKLREYPLVPCPIELDTVHELQAWSYLHTYIPVEGSKLFWITGNYNFLRR